MFIHYLRSTYQQIWAQLGLCTTLHLKKGSVSLHLNHDELSSLPAVSSRPWSSTTTDIKTPETVLCAQMEQLTVSLAFLSTSARNEISKRVKISQNSVNGKKIRSKISAESLKVKPGSSKKISVLLEECPDSTKPPEATQPQVVIRPSIIKVGGCCHEMTGLLKECSDNLFSSITLHVIPALSQLGSFVSSGQFLNKVPSSVCTRTLAKGRKRRRALPVKPSNAENGSFETTKNDSVPSKDATNDEMSLISGTEENGIQPLNINSWSSSTVKAVPRKRCLSTFNSEIAHALDLKASCNLVNTAMRIMIADTEMRQKTIKGLKIHNTSNNLATSLASLSPVMFSPGFKKSVAHNSSYVPRIVQMMTSLTRNAQTPSLRQKLAQISNISTSEFTSDTTDVRINGEPGSEKRLAAVVQARLWSMMQQTLHDPYAASQATNKRSPHGKNILSEEDDGYDDLLGAIGTEDGVEEWKMAEDDFRWTIDEGCSEKSEFNCILSDYDGTMGVEFDDLLDEEDEILLSDEDRERFETGFETEKMFFGPQWQLKGDEQYDDLLSAVEDSSLDELLLNESTDNATLGEKLSFGNDDMLLI
ncbi:hypothetical protein EYC84_005828 [Monilinia fructicola]|uniref:Uncharacterized protein n=1 Tax=Monilinia fructicola TaxID=38448 RepID=A0A5M9K2X9_MONFR|nr:hypothetical protein EYC84_005828 [Monilinia fructicola]